jgi:hypothetical protein
LFSSGIHARATSGGGYGGDGGNGGAAAGGGGGTGDALGGNGGNGGNASANGGAGGSGESGDSGDITIVNSGAITTFGDNASGFYAGSEAGDPFSGAGGNGGAAAAGGGNIGLAGAGGNGGNASTNGGAGGAAIAGDGPAITIVNSGDVTTYGASANGLHVRAFAGDARADTASGGNGGAAAGGGGGNGGTLGGSGGVGGSANANGGDGGMASGGAGGDVNVTNFARMATLGYYAHAIFINTYGGDALSGAGGNGGDAGAGGGGSGIGSAGGDTVVVNEGDLVTSGAYSNAIRIRSFSGFARGDVAPGGNGGEAAGGGGGAGGASGGAGGTGGSVNANGGNGGDSVGGDGGDVSIVNNGSVVTSGNFAEAVYVVAFASGGLGGNGGNGIMFTAFGGGGGAGASGDGGNGGSAQANGGAGGNGIGGNGGDISIVNNGSIVTSGIHSQGIYAETGGGRGTGGNGGSGGTAVAGAGGVGGAGGGNGGNGGDASANGGDGGTGQGGDAGNITIVNAGDIRTLDPASNAIFALSSSGSAYTTDGAVGISGTATNGADGLSVIGGGEGGTGGTASANGGAGGRGIAGDSGSIDIENSGSVIASGEAIRAIVTGGNGTVKIVNSGTLFGGVTSGFVNYYGYYTSVIGAGIYTNTPNTTTIINSGYLSAASLLAIESNGGPTQILNSGLIVGYVILDADDTFINEKGGVFETKLTSDFGPGNDLFRNEQGGTVLAATNPNVSEYSSFVGLERFENQGLISVQDGKEGDLFRISNVAGLPGQYFYSGGIVFSGSGKSTLAVDAFLGGPGSKSDVLIIDGDVSGKTEIKVNNTNQGLGVFNKQGIPVVYVGGNASGDEFFLKNPIDTGFFNYDLFFRPTGSGVFEFRSFLSGQALLLPQLETAAQDLWRQGSDTWFDRTADLRVLLMVARQPSFQAASLRKACQAATSRRLYGRAAPARGLAVTTARRSTHSGRISASTSTAIWTASTSRWASTSACAVYLPQTIFSCSGRSAVMSMATSITMRWAGRSTSTAGRWEAMPPIFVAGCSSTPW